MFDDYYRDLLFIEELIMILWSFINSDHYHWPIFNTQFNVEIYSLCYKLCHWYIYIWTNVIVTGLTNSICIALGGNWFLVEILTNSRFCIDVVSPFLPCSAVFLCMPFGCVHICDSSTFFTQYVPHTRESLDVFTLHIPNWQHNTTHYTTSVQLPYNTTNINNAGSFNGSDLFIWAYTLRVFLLMIIYCTRVTLSIIVITVNNSQGFIKCNFTKSIIPCLFQLDMISDCLGGNKFTFSSFSCHCLAVWFSRLTHQHPFNTVNPDTMNVKTPLQHSCGDSISP